MDEFRTSCEEDVGDRPSRERVSFSLFGLGALTSYGGLASVLNWPMLASMGLGSGGMAARWW